VGRCYKSYSPVCDLLDEVIHALVPMSQFIAAAAAVDDNEFSCFYIVLHRCPSDRPTCCIYFSPFVASRDCRSIIDARILLRPYSHTVSQLRRPHDAVAKFDTYRNVQRYRAVLPAIARHLVNSGFKIRIDTS